MDKYELKSIKRVSQKYFKVYGESQIESENKYQSLYASRRCI